MTRPLRRPGALLAASLLALALAGAAGAKSFTLPQADVTVQVAQNGALQVQERIQYAFSGPFSGGYREIPLRSGESVANVSVRENGQAYRPGGCTELGCADAARHVRRGRARRPDAHRLALRRVGRGAHVRGPLSR